MSDEESSTNGLESIEIKKKPWVPTYKTGPIISNNTLRNLLSKKNKNVLEECTIPLKRIVKYYCILSDILSNNSDNIDDNIIENFCKLTNSTVKIAKQLIIERIPATATNVRIDMLKTCDYRSFVSNYLNIINNCRCAIVRMWCADSFFRVMTLFEKENTRLLFLVSKNLVDVHFSKLDEIIDTDCVKANSTYVLMFMNHKENLKKLCSDILII